MKSHPTKISLFFILLASFALLLTGQSLYAAQEIYAVYFPNSGPVVGAYNSSGGVINANFITGFNYPEGIAVEGNELFVVDSLNGTVGAYNATTGAVINASLITGLSSPVAIAASNSKLFVTTDLYSGNSNAAKVSEYSTAGAVIDASLITGLDDPEGIAVSGSNLYVMDTAAGKVGLYDVSGASVSPSLITGLPPLNGIAVSSTNVFLCAGQGGTAYNYTNNGDLVTSWTVTNGFPTAISLLGAYVLVADSTTNSVREYTTAGSLKDSAFISGVPDSVAMAVSDAGSPTPTPTPSPTPTPKPTPTPTPPLHGGLSATSFSVNGSDTPMNILPDTILSFSAIQKGTPAGLYVRTQYSINGSTWTDLPDGQAGHMTYDPAIGQFISATTNYPAANGISFRAVSAAQGYHPDSISNVVGPFNLFSSKQRLSPPEIAVTGNGPFADLYFRSYVAAPKSGLALRVQSSTNPVNQASWTDLSDGVHGHMEVTTDPKRFYLMDNKLPAATDVYFRILGSASGYVDALSALVGPLTLTPDTPPAVTITRTPPAISGNGTQLSPYVYNPGSLSLVAKATMPASGKVEGIGMTADNELFAASLGSTVTGSYTATLGDHLIEAVAVDNKGGTSRFGTSPVYLHIISSTSKQEKSETQAGGHSDSNEIASGTSYTQVKNNGLWTDPTTWKSTAGKNGVPGGNDSATIYTYVYLSQAVSVKSVTLAGSINGGGKLVGGSPTGKNVVNTLTVSGTFACYGGSTDGTIPLNFIHLILTPDAMCNFWNQSPISLPDSTVDNYGTVNIHGGQGVTGLANFHNLGSTSFQTPLTLPFNAGADPTVDTRMLSAKSVPTSGLISSSLVSTPTGMGASSLIKQNADGIVAQGGGNIVAQGGGNIVAQGGGNIVAQGGGNIVAQGGGNIVAQGGGNESLPPNEHAETVPAGFVQTGGETNLDGLIISGPVTLDGGVLSGSGIIYGDLTNNASYISPGHSPGAIGVMGSFTQGANGTLVIQDGGAEPDQFDQLQVAGKATLGGTLNLQLINGYKPSTKDTFSPLGYGEMAGKFATISSNATVHMDATGLTASVDSTIPGPVPAASRNISTRAFVQTGQNVVIGGFIVSGPAGSSKKVIIRGIGPSLAAAGIQGALADPVLQLFKGSAQLTTNDNWTENRAAVQPTGLAPKDDSESAIVATLEPGSYTAILSGANNTTGVGLVEVYDLAPDSAASLANISTRCSVQTGDQVLIGGFILDGAEPAQVLVRALGPSLSAFGIKGALADPTLALYDANGDATTNDDWINTQKAEITATGLAPSNNKDSAILATLPPGAYTAIVAGKDGGTGIALVEVYHVQ